MTGGSRLSYSTLYLIEVHYPQILNAFKNEESAIFALYFGLLHSQLLHPQNFSRFPSHLNLTEAGVVGV